MVTGIGRRVGRVAGDRHGGSGLLYFPEGCLLPGGVMKGIRRVLRVLGAIVALAILTGATQVDRYTFEVVFDKASVEPSVVFELAKEYVASQGFILETTHREAEPVARTVAEYRAGRAYEGGVFLLASLSDDGTVSLEAVRFRAGCSKPRQIEAVAPLQQGLLEHLKTKGVDGAEVRPMS